MKISKDAAVRAVGTPDGEELALINALARRELGADEVYAFALRLCDNDIDRDFERFGDETLEALAPMFVGVSGVFDHQWSARGQTARIYRTQVVDEDGTATSDGRPYRCLMGWAYLMRTEGNAALIAEIDGGIKREVSVGCAVDQVVCSICGEELDSCPHERGEEYDGQVCCGVLTGASDVYEWSFVAVPAQRRAGVVKSAGRTRDEARLGRKYLKSLRRELVRAAGAAEPELGHALLEQVAARLDEEELLGLIRVYRAKAGRMLGAGVQLDYSREDSRPGQADGAFLI
jgi:hypothetical protein